MMTDQERMVLNCEKNMVVVVRRYSLINSVHRTSCWPNGRISGGDKDIRIKVFDRLYVSCLEECENRRCGQK
jgi:hypothetical protein